MIDSDISIVIPIYNSESAIIDLVEKLIDELADFRDYRIILVNDSSSDNSSDAIKKLALSNRKILSIDLDGNYGQQSAVFCGLGFVKTDYVVIMDDDGEHNPRDIKKLHKEIIKGFDVVYALNSNSVKQTFIRKAGSKLRDFTFNHLTEKPKDLKVCSFRILNKQTVNNILKARSSFVYISMEILKHTVNIANIKVAYGIRNVSGHSFFKLAALILKIYIYYSKSKMLSKLRHMGPAFKILSITESERN